ncbi:MAG: flagellar hook-basal body complex protein FliE [Waddliaceae bacterium]|nr:flagellar hook-basal body complex protein FliE [Waddliaceae bacterium]|tara:strand:+ start:90 stop:440 length:351 start_codon:yes stop_codon:yes gene_type:complete
MSGFGSEALTKLNPLMLRPKPMTQAKGLGEINVHLTPAPAQLEETYTFQKILGGYLSEVNTLQHEADAQIQRLAAGEVEDVSEVTMAMDEAETAFKMMMEIRNKLLDAWSEIKHMQ